MGNKSKEEGWREIRIRRGKKRRIGRGAVGKEESYLGEEEEEEKRKRTTETQQ